MAAPQSGTRSWTQSTWVKWSWLLIVGLTVAQSLTFHWRVLPTGAAGHFARGRADYLNGEYVSAVSNFSDSIERNPTDARALVYRGQSYAELREFGKALADIDRAIQLRPEEDTAHAARGDLLALCWDTKGALAGYSRALELDPGYARCYLERGKLSYDLERFSSAAADFSQGATRLLTDKQVTAELLLWMARARTGEAFGATSQLLDVLRVGRIRGDRFWAGAQFLTGQITESAYLAALANMKNDDPSALMAEAYFLAGGKRLAFGDRSGGLDLMQDALATEARSSYAYDRARVELETLLVGFHPMWTVRAGAGLEIASVTPDGPAEAAGLRPGFILASIAGAAADQESFVEFLAAAEPGGTVELELKDGAGANVSLTLTLTPGSSAPTR